MKDLYILINDSEILKYNGEILKRVIGNKVVKVISNPTEEDLKEFGYMELSGDLSEVPEYNPDTQEIRVKYRVVDNTIRIENVVVNKNDNGGELYE